MLLIFLVRPMTKNVNAYNSTCSQNHHNYLGWYYKFKSTLIFHHKIKITFKINYYFLVILVCYQFTFFFFLFYFDFLYYICFFFLIFFIFCYLSIIIYLILVILYLNDFLQIWIWLNLIVRSLQNNGSILNHNDYIN